MKKVSIIGHYAYGLKYLDGQTIKTKIVTETLKKEYSQEQILEIDTHGGIKTLLKSPFQIIKALKNSENVIILPAHNGVRVYGLLLPILRCFFKKRKIHYAVIGGWLPKFIENKKILAKALKRFDGIYVETTVMKKNLEEMGFENVLIMPNFKELKVLKEEELTYFTQEPYRLCTFSRVSKEKGIGDAVNTVKKINETLGRTFYTLDIYGQVDSGQEDWFEELKKNFPEYVKYGGLVDFDKSVEVLKGYFALLFPTHFYTEGIPGTIIDAYAAGLPVISAKWQNFSDIVEDGKTGFGYEFENTEDLENKLLDISKDVSEFNLMKVNCLNKCKQFLPSEAIKTICSKL